MIASATKRIQKAMDEATSYDEWKAAAIEHDERSGMATWKARDRSQYFDYKSIRRRLERLRSLRAQDDNAGLLFALNEGIHGNIDGMGRGELYGQAKFGTKQLIADYVDEISDALELLAGPDADDIAVDERLDFFRRAQHCYGMSALMMSGSGSLLFFHIGVVKALWEQGLLPDILSGSSGGAFVGSLVSTHSDRELERIFEPENIAYEIKKEAGLIRHVAAFKPEVMKIEEVEEALQRLVADLTFQEAFELTGRNLNVSVAAAEKHQTSRLLNAITTPNVYIREAVLASSAVPGFFPPVTLAAKNYLGERQPYMPSRKWVDGSISDDLPAKRLARLYGANHFIVSQTNPHIFPFVTDAKRAQGFIPTLQYATTRTVKEWLNASASLMEKPLSLSPAASRWTNMALAVINQDYVGDINILPEKRFFNPLKILAHKSAEQILELITMGEKAAWPKIEMIRIQSKIGRKLNRILAEFDYKLVRRERRATRRAS